MADSRWHATQEDGGAAETRSGRNSAQLGRVTMLASAPFADAVAGLRSVTPRPEITVSEINAPQRVAPYAFALGAEVTRSDEVLATGRLVLLFNPAGEPAWDGTMRVVSYVTAEVEPEIAAEPGFAQVCWGWHIESLRTAEADHKALAGTVTQVNSTRFDGELEPGRNVIDIELRASWTPLGANVTEHAEAWFLLLATSASLPPPGVTVLQPRR